MSQSSNFATIFAEILDGDGHRIHIGCIMSAGQDWLEVSLPEQTQLTSEVKVRFFPSLVVHDVLASWRDNDRVGFTYENGGPPEDHFAGIPGLTDPRPAELKKRAFHNWVLSR
jgi:hypothetical protein